MDFPSWKPIFFFILLFTLIFLYYRYSYLIPIYLPWTSYLYYLLYGLSFIIIMMMMYMPSLFTKIQESYLSEDPNVWLKQKYVHNPILPESPSKDPIRKKKRKSEMDST